MSSKQAALPESQHAGGEPSELIHANAAASAPDALTEAASPESHHADEAPDSVHVSEAGSASGALAEAAPPEGQSTSGDEAQDLVDALTTGLHALSIAEPNKFDLSRVLKSRKKISDLWLTETSVVGEVGSRLGRVAL